MAELTDMTSLGAARGESKAKQVCKGPERKEKMDTLLHEQQEGQRIAMPAPLLQAIKEMYQDVQACRRAVTSVAKGVWSVQKTAYLHMSWLDIIDFPQPLWHGFRKYFGAQTR
eukprot:1160539-Pelagomonas_calceolata.AAC.1